MRQVPRLVAALAPAASLVLAGCLVLASAMTDAPDHDENMYVTAGVLLDDLSMYADFAFLRRVESIGEAAPAAREPAVRDITPV